MEINNNYQNRGFGSEIFDLQPLSWVILIAFAASVYIFAELAFFVPITRMIETPFVNLRSKTYHSYRVLDDLWEGLNNLPGLSEENAKLRDQNTQLKSKLSEVEVVFKENQRLINETGINYDRKYKSVGVKVLALNNSEPGMVLINKGRQEGINKGDVAVQEKILLGQVSEVGEHTAKVKLLVQASSQLPVKNNKENVGIVTGKGSQLIVEQILQTKVINKNDKVFSAGVDGNFPPDLYIGEVNEIKSDERATTKTATIISPIEWNKLEQFKILLIERN